MSDLHCPVRVFVARHGQATYDSPSLLTDDGGWLTELGREQAAALAGRLADQRIAAVYSSPMERAVQTARIAATALGVGQQSVPGIEEFHVGDLAGQPFSTPGAFAVYEDWMAGRRSTRWPGAQTGDEVVAGFEAAIEEIADRHRGEAVLVVSHGGVTSLSIPALAGNVPDGLAANRPLDNCAYVEVHVDADGWELVGGWPEAVGHA